MFYPPRKTGMLFPQTGKANAYGVKSFAEKGQPFGWGPVHTRENLAMTPVRADTSASKARIEQIVYDMRILVEKKVTPEKGDKIVLDGKHTLKVVRVFERMDIRGRLHHWEVDCATL